MNEKYITLNQLTTVTSALLNKFEEKVNETDLAEVAFTGSYNDLENRPNLNAYATKASIENWAINNDGPFMIKGTDYVTAGQASISTLGDCATAEGHSTTASGEASHAEGYSATASGEASHAEGSDTTASGDYSHAEGAGTTASGEDSHAEGYYTTASGGSSHAEGYHTTASGGRSHAEGYYTTAQRRSQHVFGEYNILDTTGSTTSEKGSYIEIVGKGTSNSARSNARTLDWSGNETLAGTLTIGGANGWTLSVDSSGNLTMLPASNS